MAKRFTDTNKYKKPFIRSLQGPYKLLWDYLYHDCDHAGIWIVDFDIAQVYLGADMPINKDDALKYFNADEERIIVIDGGKKWFILPFIQFQYGILNSHNRVHSTIINHLLQQKVDIKLIRSLQGPMGGLASPLQGAMDMDTDKDKEMDKEKEKSRARARARNSSSRTKQQSEDPWAYLSTFEIQDPELTEKWKMWVDFRKKLKKPYKTKEGEAAAYSKLIKLAEDSIDVAMQILDQSMANEWLGLFSLKVDTITRINKMKNMSPARRAYEESLTRGSGDM